VDLGTVRRWLEDELSAGEEQSVAEHLKACAICAQFVENERATQAAHDLTIGLAVKQEGMLCYSEDELRTYLAGDMLDEEAENVRIHLEVNPCERCSAVLAELSGESSFSPTERARLRRRVMRETAGGSQK